MQRAKSIPIPIADILGKTAKRLKMAQSLHLQKLWSQWPFIVGETIAQHALPAKAYGKTLVIRAEHPTWVQELTYLHGEIIERIQQVLPKSPFTKIRCEVGPLPALPKRFRERPSVVSRDLDEEEVAFIHRAAHEIPDDEVREAAQRAMRRCFACMSRERS